jgi:hypothetical protein
MPDDHKEPTIPTAEGRGDLDLAFDCASDEQSESAGAAYVMGKLTDLQTGNPTGRGIRATGSKLRHGTKLGVGDSFDFAEGDDWIELARPLGALKPCVVVDVAAPGAAGVDSPARRPSSHPSGLPPQSRSVREDGAYCLVRDQSGVLAPVNAPEQCGAASLRFDLRPDAGASHEDNLVAMVPSPVVAIEDPRGGARSASIDSGQLRSGLTRASIVEPKTVEDSSPSAPEGLAIGVPSSPKQRLGSLSFDPSLAYPNVPAARPFIPDSGSASRRKQPKAASAWWFRTGIVGIPFLGVALASGIHFWGGANWPWLVAAGCVGVGTVSSAILLHRAWASIDDGAARTTPAKALLLLLVPVFNVYWGFNVCCGFATDYNRFLRRHRINARPLSRNLILATMLPAIGVVFSWRLIAAVCEAINQARRR